MLSAGSSDCGECGSDAEGDGDRGVDDAVAVDIIVSDNGGRLLTL